MKNEYFVLIGILCLLVFYTIVNVFVLGGLQFSVLVVELALAMFITILVTGFLGTNLAGLKQIPKEHIFLVTVMVHIASIFGFWMIMMVTSTRYFGEISPLTGHIFFSVSIIIQGAIVIPNRTERWLQFGSIGYLAVYVLFSFWQYVPFSVLGLLFVYVVLYNISVFSYGIIQYVHLLKAKQTRLETE